MVSGQTPTDGYVSLLPTAALPPSSDSHLPHRAHRADPMKFSGLGKAGLLHTHGRMGGRHVRARGGRHRSALSLIAELGSESNAHGLAKIVTSTDNKRKVIWSLLVILGVTAATLQLSLLVTKYFKFQVVELSEIKDSIPVEFPSVTVCNLEPISWRKVRNLITPEAEFMKWINFVNSYTFGDQELHMNSIRAFYENLQDDAKLISHDINDFLIKCRFHQKECYRENFTTSFDGNYFNCFTFNGADSGSRLLMHATGPENGLSLIISLDNDDPPRGTYGVYSMNSNILHSAGVRVVVHAPNTMPNPVDHGFDIPPGYSSSIGLKAIQHTRLSYPYGNCTTEDLQAEQVYKNTFFSCLQLCKQKLIIARCKCKSSGLPETEDSNVTHCGVVPDWHSYLPDPNQTSTRLRVPRLACEESVLYDLANDRSYETSCKCYQPCSEMTYQKSVSLSYWPLEFYQMNALQLFYGKGIQDHFMNEAYMYLKNMSDMGAKIKESDGHESTEFLLTELSDEEKAKYERTSNLIRQNLLRLNIYLEDLSVVEFRQLPAYGLADLFADIGGTLGLWMGISVLTIMELMELILRLIFMLFNTERPVAEDDTVVNGVLPDTDLEQLESRDLHKEREYADFHDGEFHGDEYRPRAYEYSPRVESPP